MKDSKGWISTKDRLPEENVSVLVFIPEEDDHITTGMWDVSKKWVLLDEYRVPRSQVTYWHEMIPQPEDKSFQRTHDVSGDDTMTNTIRRLQKRNYDLEKTLKQAKEACDIRLLGMLNVCKNMFVNLGHKTLVDEISEYEDRIAKAMETINKLGL